MPVSRQVEYPGPQALTQIGVVANQLNRFRKDFWVLGRAQVDVPAVLQRLISAIR